MGKANSHEAVYRLTCKDSFSLGSASTWDKGELAYFLSAASGYVPCPDLVSGGIVLFGSDKHHMRYSAFVALGSWWRRRTSEIGVEDLRKEESRGRCQHQVEEEGG